MTAQLQAVAGLRDELAGPMADTILAAPSQYHHHAVLAALVTRAMISWDKGQIGEGLELFRDACRYGTRISPDARHFQPLLALAAALVDLRQLDEAESILRSADNQALDGIPAQAVLSILRARIHMANGQLSDAATAGQAALAIAETMGAHGYASTAHCILGVIALRRGDIAAATHHVASRSAPSPHFADTYARAETAMAPAQVGEGRDGRLPLIGRSVVCADLPAHRGSCRRPHHGNRADMHRTGCGRHAIGARTAEAPASDNPGFAPVTAAVAQHGTCRPGPSALGRGRAAP